VTRRVLPLVVLVVATNLAMLASVRANRAGNSDVLMMTEREVSRQFDDSDRDSALRLVLRHEDALDWRRVRERETLPALGLTCERPTTERPGAWRRCGLARRVFVALEYDGPAWQAIAAERMRERDEALEKVRQGDASAQSRADYLDASAKYGTRLVLIDASLDAEALRRAHPDRRVMILPGTARAWLTEDESSPSRQAMTGIVSILTTELLVPMENRAAVPPQSGSDYGRPISGPRYAVAIRIGRHHEPWIESVAPIDSSGTPR
jgi:hypothetical protein